MMPGKPLCAGITHKGAPCAKSPLPGFDFCLRHLPDEQVLAAEALGYERCKAIVHGEGNPRKGMRCAESPVNGSGYCVYHQKGGNWIAPPTLKDRRMIAKIHRIAPEEGIDTTKVANPLQALLELAAEAYAFKEELKRRVVSLRENEWRYESIAGEQVRADIVLYERAMDRLARQLTVIAKLGIEERLARVTERQAFIVEQAVVAALEDLGLPVDVQDRARGAVGRRLRAVE